MSKQRLFALASVAMLTWTTSDARAGMITILNSGFENLTGSPNSTHFDALGGLRLGHFSGITSVGNSNEFVTSNPIPSWSVTGNDVGTDHQTASVFPSIPEGQNTAYIGGTIGGGTISQTLSAMLAIGTYTLQIDAGNPGTLSFAGYDIQLLAGSTVVAEDHNTLSPATTTFLTSTLTYMATASDPNLGENLTIRLSAISPGFGSQTDFDDVRLNFASVPEPASIVMVGLGAVLVLGATWRRKRSRAAASVISERHRLRIGLLAVGLLGFANSFAGQARAGMVYDAVNDFSLVSNPNGPWSYGALSSLTNGTFTVFTSAVVNGDYPGAQTWLTGSSIPNYRVVQKNASGSTATFANGGIVQPTNVLRLDGQGGIADVRFTAPTTGVYNIDGFFQRIDTGGYPVSVRVLLNGTALFAVDKFRTFNSQETFNLDSMTLSAGEILDFAEGAPQFNNDSTGLAATITFVGGTVPEPASIVMVGLGAVTILGATWYRKCSRTATPS